MFFIDRSKKTLMVNEQDSLPGRTDEMQFNESHFVNNSCLKRGQEKLCEEF